MEIFTAYAMNGHCIRLVYSSNEMDEKQVNTLDRFDRTCQHADRAYSSESIDDSGRLLIDVGSTHLPPTSRPIEGVHHRAGADSVQEYRRENDESDERPELLRHDKECRSSFSPAPMSETITTSSVIRSVRWEFSIGSRAGAPGTTAKRRTPSPTYTIGNESGLCSSSRGRTAVPRSAMATTINPIS